MANEVHVEILRRSAEAWSRWRKENREVVADLRRADFNRADLRGADLRGADLRGTSFDCADLRGADLRGVDLDSAHLIRTQLTCAPRRSEPTF